MTLNERIVNCVTTFPKVDDYDQRSALGMVRSWADKGALDTWNPDQHKDMPNRIDRDNLAKALVAIFEEEDADKDQIVEALSAARKKVNQPFIDPSMLGQQNREGNWKREKKG